MDDSSAEAHGEGVTGDAALAGIDAELHHIFRAADVPIASYAAALRRAELRARGGASKRLLPLFLSVCCLVAWLGPASWRWL